MESASTGRAEFDGEFRVVWSADGGTHHLRARSRILRNTRGEAVRVIGVAWDVTRQKEVEKQMAQERQLMRAMMEHIPDTIYFKDAESRFVCVNNAKLAKHGLKDMAEIIGKTDFDLFTNDRAQDAFDDEQRILRTGEALVDHEEKDVWPDGSETWVSTTKLPLRDDHGCIVGTFGLSRDITQRKHAEEALESSKAELLAKNNVLEEDLEMARELQSAMLPHRYPSFPHIATAENSALHFYHYYHPSMTVGGDFFDVLEISDHAAGVFICDVMGHGVRAALVAATLRAIIGELRSAWMEPAELLTRVNRALRSSLKNTGVPLFASAFYMVVDLNKREVCYANAGHPHPLRVHQSSEGPKVSRLNGLKPGPVLGIFDEAHYFDSRSELSLHDTILLFTDGLIEVEASNGQLFDYPLLLNAVSKRGALPTAELCRGVVDEVQRFSANKEFSDDVCLIATTIDRLVLS
jgi:sigma-B regulation protein RsbU (phosphoserine phosphatase)